MRRKLITSNGPIPFVGGASVRGEVTIPPKQQTKEQQIIAEIRRFSRLSSFVRSL